MSIRDPQELSHYSVHLKRSVKVKDLLALTTNELRIIKAEVKEVLGRVQRQYNELKKTGTETPKGMSQFLAVMNIYFTSAKSLYAARSATPPEEISPEIRLREKEIELREKELDIKKQKEVTRRHLEHQTYVKARAAFRRKKMFELIRERVGIDTFNQICVQAEEFTERHFLCKF